MRNRFLSAAALAVLGVFLSSPAPRAAGDLPGPAPNLETLPQGSLVIAMDNDKQNIGANFNLLAYGLVNDLLHNDIPVKWAIRAGKLKDGIDFSAQATRVYPVPALPPSAEDFRGGPFVVHKDYVDSANPFIAAFGNDVAVYELGEDVVADVRYTLTHKPYVAVFDDGGREGIHRDVLLGAGFSTPAHFVVIPAAQVVDATACYTIGTEPHWSEVPNDPLVDAAAAAIRQFLSSGGNFLAQCAAIETYENNVAGGRYQTTLGIVVNNVGTTPFLYPNADLPYSQFQGAVDKGSGSVHDWELEVGSAWQNNAHTHVQDTPATSLVAASVSKLTAGTGGLAHYLGSHSYGDKDLPDLNGRRMYLNAIMTPAVRPGSCGFDIILRDISGTVYEDGDGDAGLGDAVGAPGVRVRLYADGNDDGVVDATDTFIAETNTDVNGAYAFEISQGLSGSKYLVTVDSKTVGGATGAPSAVYNGGFGAGDVWAEQTYGDDPATAALDLGPRYGGRTPSVSDDVDPASTAAVDNAYQHVARVDVTAADAPGVDFAFSFNIVTSTRDGDDDASANRTIQGSLRQFTQNANAISGGNLLRFVPAVATNASGSGGDWWQVALVGSPLPALSDGDTEVNGAAYCAWNDGTQGCTATTQTRDDNPGQSGNPDVAGNAVGTGVDGLTGSGDEPTLPAYDRPELEINAGDLGVALDMAAAGGTIRGVAVFNTLAGGPAVRFTAGTGGVLAASFLGPRADGTDPGAGSRIDTGVELSGGAADVTANWIAFAEGSGCIVAEASLVSGNDVYRVALSDATGDGISTLGSGGQPITIRENRVDRAGAFGIDSWMAPGPFTVEDNTVLRSGLGSATETGGIRIFGTGSTVRHNVVTESVGAGIVLAQRGAPGSNQQNRVSENSLYANGGLSIDIDITHTGAGDTPDGDGVTGNDGATAATLPNIDMDYPVFDLVLVSGSGLYVEGHVGTSGTPVAGVHTVEVFKADDDGNNDGEVERLDGQSVAHGEGRWFLDSCATAADGTFACNLAVPASVTLGSADFVTASATDPAGNSSELGPNVAPATARIVKRAFQIDGTPLPSGSTVPTGMPVKFLVYVNNAGPVVADVSLQDVLDPTFLYVAGSARFDNSLSSCAALDCSVAEEAAIFAAADAGTPASDGEDGDVFSFSGVTLNVGNQAAANAQLDLAAGRIWALVFTIRMQ